MTVVPVYNVLVVPDSNIFFAIDAYKKMTGRAPFEGEKVIMMMLHADDSREDLKKESFYPIGVSGIITEVNAGGYLVIRTHGRVHFDEITVYSDHTIELSVSRKPDIEDLDPAYEEDRLLKLKNVVIEYTSQFQWGALTQAYAEQWTNIGEIASIMSPWLNISNEERYALLAEDSRKARSEAMEKILYENLEMFHVNNEARNAQEEGYQKVYREQAIKKQIEYLQKELDEMHPENITDVRRFQVKIEESGMNEEARKEADKVLNRYKQEGQNSPESGMLYDYLDFITGLSWKNEDAQEIDLDEAEAVLEEDHFGLKKVKERIIQQIAVMNLKKQQSGSILCFVGAPGTGKTSIGQSIAKALHRKYARVSLGGVRDEADIRGHRRTYIGARPGRIMDGIQKSGVSNPVMVLDEIDKLSVSYNGDPASALLEVLDPEQNSTFTDHYMNAPYDLSNVLFICTANTLETIPEPLLNRMEVIQFQGYTATDKLQIARRHLLPKAMQTVGIEPGQIEISDDIIKVIISDYTQEGGVRGLRKRLETLCRAAAVRIVRGKGETIVVTKENLRDLLDMHPVYHKQVKESAKPGIVTGLAWTAAGGEILYIETLLTKGKGEIVITGQLGDVMKESARIAVTLVKSLFPEQTAVLEENDLHIHVPDGATPKDGPSAGITLTTALSSLVTGTPVPPSIGMTGEVSLQGGVNPIGGLPEKLLAAQRAGVKKVFIPADNVDDLRDVPEEVKENLEIVPVEEASEVLKALGIMK
ncbi:MAG: endopeptidase La [Lachnospiraceae bacterium]|nr:endopeptidase La [Lachnospiraceae bacterium]